MKRSLMSVAVVSFLFAAAAYAQMPGAGDHEHGTAATREQMKQTEAATPGAIDAGNKSCPISGDPVSGKDFVTYQGVRYGLCCKSCDKMFLKDPNKYIQKLREKGEIK